MTRHPHYPPACLTCGASLPHSNPMAWQYHYSRAEKHYTIGQQLLLDVATPNYQEGKLIEKFYGKTGILFYKIEDSIGRRFHAPSDNFISLEEWEQQKEGNKSC